VPERNIVKLIQPANVGDQLTEIVPVGVCDLLTRAIGVRSNLKRSCRLSQSCDAFFLRQGVQRALAAAPSACRFRGEKSLLFVATKTKWKILDEAIVWWAPFMAMVSKMSNDNLRAVKREVAPKLRRPRYAPAVTTQPVKEAMDRPRLLSDRLRLHSDRRKIENDEIVLETFTLPLEAARLKVRDIIHGISQRGYQEVVERWRQLPNGQIEFAVRHLPFAD
jgi:hypothetical protein